MGQSASDLTKIKCECGVSLKVPKSAVGKKAKCPKCGKVFVIAEPPPKEDSVYGLSSEPDESSFLDDLANLERSGTKIDETPDEGRTARCSKCGADIAEKARICTQCGYDKESGRTLATAKVAKPSSPGLVRRLAASMGGLLKGTLLSGVGAAVGAALWAVIAIMSGYEIGWIAIGVGALAGYGMHIGYPAENARAGFVAACMALFGILLGKLFIFVFFVHALITGNTSDIDIQRMIVAEALTEERLTEKGIWGEERDEQWESVSEDVEREVEGWSDEGVQARAAELKAEQDRQNAYFDEDGLTIMRVARHRAARRADKLGLAPDHPDREKLYPEEFDACKKLSKAQLADELKAIDQWRESDRWADETYVYNHLIEQKTEKAIEDRRTEKEVESPDDYWEPNEAERKGFREAAKTEVDDLSPDARLTQAQSIEDEQEREYRVSSLANHYAMRRGNAAGLSYGDPKRDELLDEESKRCEALDDDALKKATTTMTAWEENDKWSDDAYVRDNLIYMFARNAIEKQREEEHADEEEYWTPTPEEWTEFHTAAADVVDAIPPGKRVQRTHDEEARLERVQEERFAAAGREEAAELAAGVVAAYFSMFGIFDGLFLLLAVSAAWRIAQGGTDD